MKIRKPSFPFLTALLIHIFLGFVRIPLAAANETRTFAGITFVLIESGCFKMGSHKPPTERTVGETPAHQVCIDKPFYIGETEVTQRQWQEVMGKNPSKSKVEDKPVERVSWNDVQDFIQQLNAREGGALFRLPTEAEWEYAARAGSETDYCYGDSPGSLAAYAWFGNLGYNGTPQIVGQKKANDWGLRDVHGNVWEWVQDWYGPYSDGSQTNPTGPESGKFRVYRGGSYVGKASEVRSSVRYSALPTAHTQDLGFRLVRQLE